MPKTDGEANTSLEPDGTIVISVNPGQMTGTTLSHELAHVIQQAVFHNTRERLLKERDAARARGTPEKELKKDDAIIDEAVLAGRVALHGIAKVADVEDDKFNSTDYKENEAVRFANIVAAERTAAEIKAELQAHPVSDPKKIVEMFWRRQLDSGREISGHEGSQKPLPKGTRYGKYDYARVLELLGNNVTLEQLKQWREDNLGGH